MTPTEITIMVTEFLKAIKDRPIFKGPRYGEKRDCQHVSSYLTRMSEYFYPNQMMTTKMLLKAINRYDSYRGTPVKFTRHKVYKEITYEKPFNLAYIIAIKSTTITLHDKTLELASGDLFIIGPSMKTFLVFGREFIVLS